MRGLTALHVFNIDCIPALHLLSCAAGEVPPQQNISIQLRFVITGVTAGVCCVYIRTATLWRYNNWYVLQHFQHHCH